MVPLLIQHLYLAFMVEPLARNKKEFEYAALLLSQIASWTEELDGAKVCQGRRLVYASYRFAYTSSGKPILPKERAYQTDLLIYDDHDGDSWIPRVVIECKYGSASTHDLLTYGRKAQAHRTLHPYLRYGFLVGDSASRTISLKMVMHGSDFDFLSVLPETDTGQLEDFRGAIAGEIQTSRTLWNAYSGRVLPEGTHLIQNRVTLSGRGKAPMSPGIATHGRKPQVGSIIQRKGIAI